MTTATAKKWDYLNIVCGECGAPMEVRSGEWGAFYGCTEHPKCYNRFTSNVYEMLLEKVYEKVLAEGSAEGLRFDIKRSRLKITARVTKATDQQVTLATTNLAQRRAR